jgi:hypothetical protein
VEAKPSDQWREERITELEERCQQLQDELNIVRALCDRANEAIQDGSDYTRELRNELIASRYNWRRATTLTEEILKHYPNDCHPCVHCIERMGEIRVLVLQQVETADDRLRKTLI